MTLETLLQTLASNPESVEFSQVMKVITENYTYTPTEFMNGTVKNASGTNEGSCKIFAFAKLNELTELQTLHCFGEYYRHDVLLNPEGSDHANIRNFMQTGLSGILFEKSALVVI